MSSHHGCPRAPRCGALLATLALLAASALQAQRAPRLTLSLGGGAVPEDNGAVDRERAPGVTASVGVRQPIWRALFVEGAVQGQSGIAFNDQLQLTMLPGVSETPSYRYYVVDDDLATGTAIVARVGAQLFAHRTDRPLVRAAAGVGRLSGTVGPLTSVALGLSSPGRRVRLTLDADAWWYRVRAQEIRSTIARGPEQVMHMVERPVRLGLRSTFVRAGVELALGRP